MNQRPNPEDTLSLKMQQLIDSQCIGFEDRLRSGSAPSIEEFVSKSQGIERRELLFELLMIDLDYQRRQGEPPSLSDYITRFPDDADTVRAAFESSTRPASDDKPDDGPPQKIARYEIVRAIGSGGFGVVYEGFDPKLQRRVAIKVQRPQSNNYTDVELAEAQTIAKLAHPNIVPVFDVGSTAKFPCYIVSAFVDGVDLADRSRERKLTLEEAVSLVANIADALDYGHEQGVIHRDVKPRNILIDSEGTAFLVDFGLALREEEFATGPEMVGTPAYMSPEQARGEGHRVDGRSDIFSLGSILYELLTGRRPFEHDEVQTLLMMVEKADPPPLIESVAGLPKELQRVCSKAMARRVDDRYANGREFSDDLRTALESEYDSVIEQKVPRGVVPRGLRSYGAEDADFFLQLLPGPRDRRGLSRLLKQLLSRVEATAQGEGFSTGVVFGPSGCGKSSLMKAGVLPRTNARVRSVYFEATAEHTTSGLQRQILQQFDFADDSSLRDMLTWLRRGDGLKPGEKLVIVIDQFEQWLHVNPRPADTELLAALRQCDGSRVQCILMVRDDFWFATNRFMQALEVPILEGTNSFAVDLFDSDHALRILTSFGQAFDRVEYPPSAEQAGFLVQATAELLEGDNVSPVRLALFAEMMKNRKWSPETLNRLGGATGVGLRFFEETFDSPTGTAATKRNSDAVRTVLTSLLPEGDTNIKGSSQPRSALLVQCDDNPEKLDEVLRLLDRDLRLITPIESDAPDSEPAYQLAHDYLVPSIRRWLAKYQKETFSGRAEARLIDRTAAWFARPENQQLPGLRDFSSIRLFTESKRWTDRQREMMSRGARVLALRWGVIVTLACIVGVVALMAYQTQNLKRTQGLVSSFQGAAPAGIPFVVTQLEQEGSLPTTVIDELLEDKQLEPLERFRLVLARSLLAEPDLVALLDPKTIQQLPGEECPNIVRALRRSGDSESVVRTAWKASFDAFRREFPSDALNYDTQDMNKTAAERAIRQPERLRALQLVSRYAIVLLHLGSREESQSMLAYSRYPERRSAWLYEFARWHGDLTDLDEVLTPDTEDSLLSGVCIAIGSTGSPSQSDRRVLGPTLLGLFDTHPDSGVHAAAEFALRKWNVPTPPASAPDDAEWARTRFDFTLVRVPRGKFTRFRFVNNKDAGKQYVPERQTVLMENFFCISSTEVSLELYLRFVKDPEWPDDLKPASMKNRKTKEIEPWGYHENISRSPDCPVQQVNFDDAILFCNWLSHKDDREQCYTKNSDGDWRVDTRANGYRLPTESEWEYSSRAGTDTFWFSGQDEVVLQDYAAYTRTSDYGTRPCGSFIPNPWGLFDTNGNVREWCWDWFEYWPEGVSDVIAGWGPNEPNRKNRSKLSPGPEPTRIRRGGCFTDRAEGMRSDRRAGHRPNGPDSRQSRLGFRVARNADN